MSDPALESAFPNLARTPYRETSPQDGFYNCIAWAAGLDDAWWWPDPIDVAQKQGTEWPIARREVSIECFVEAFATLGYTVCGYDDSAATLEPNLEKVCLYVEPATKVPTHMARQLPSGEWTSKCGPYKDIEHRPEGLTDSEYGQIHLYMSRPV